VKCHVLSKPGRKRVSFSVSESSVVVLQESRTPGPSGCSVQHAAKITRLDAPLAVMYEPTINCVVLCHEKCGYP
jgi:hypothetical protein